MKKFLTLVILGSGGWVALTRTSKGQQVQKAVIDYVHGLTGDINAAKDSAQKMNDQTNQVTSTLDQIKKEQ